MATVPMEVSGELAVEFGVEVLLVHVNRWRRRVTIEISGGQPVVLGADLPPVIVKATCRVPIKPGGSL